MSSGFGKHYAGSHLASQTRVSLKEVKNMREIIVKGQGFIKISLWFHLSYLSICVSNYWIPSFHFGFKIIHIFMLSDSEFRSFDGHLADSS